MSAEINAITLLGDNIAQYVLGSYTMLAIVVVAFFLLLLLSTGMEIKYSVVLTLPLIAIYYVGGWFASATYIYNISLFVISLIYAFAVIKLYGR